MACAFVTGIDGMRQVERYRRRLKCGCIALQAESGQGFEFALRFLDAFECIVPKRIYSVAKQCLECRYYHLSRSFEHERLCYNVMLTADIARM